MEENTNEGTNIDYSLQYLVFVGLTKKSRKKKGNARRQRALLKIGEKMVKQAFRKSEVELPENICLYPALDKRRKKVLGGIWETNWATLSWKIKPIYLLGEE